MKEDDLAGPSAFSSALGLDGIFGAAAAILWLQGDQWEGKAKKRPQKLTLILSNIYMSPSKQLSTFWTPEFLCSEKMYPFFSHCRSSSLLLKDETNHTVERAWHREQPEPETIQGTAWAVSAFGAYQFPKWRFSNIQVGLGKLSSHFDTLIYQFCGSDESPKWVQNGRDHFGVG